MDSVLLVVVLWSSTTHLKLLIPLKAKQEETAELTPPPLHLSDVWSLASEKGLILL